MKIASLILVYTFWMFVPIESCFSQPCVDGLTIFRTQSEVDEFPLMYPGCTEVSGTFVLTRGSDDPIYNLDSLRQLRIMSSLILRGTEELVNLEGLNNVSRIDRMSLKGNEKLENLDGLDSLKTLGGISIVKNPVLNDLSALSQIEEVEKIMSIHDNRQLQSLHGLENLTRVGENFYIQFNENLEGLEGLQALKSIGGSFIIGNNPRLHHLEGLNNLSIVEKHLFIIANEELEDFSGLEGLHHIGFNNQPGTIFIANNNHLKNIDGLLHLKTMSGTLGIWNNHQLTSIEGIKNIDVTGVVSTVPGYEDFILYNNLELSTCNNSLVCDIISDAGKTTLIFGNKDNCENSDAIYQVCTTVENTEIDFLANNLKVVPNPNRGTFMLWGVGQKLGTIRVYDMNGKCIYSGQKSSKDEFLLTIEQSGVYILRFDDDTGESITRKVLVF